MSNPIDRELKETRARQKLFQTQNNIGYSTIIDKYPAMNGKIDKDNLFAACSMMYPGSAAIIPWNISGSGSQLNYLDVINKAYESRISKY